jgi:hypothetical protein
VGALHAGRVLVLVHSESAQDDIAAAINLDRVAPRCSLIEPTTVEVPRRSGGQSIAEEAPDAMLASVTGLLAPHRDRR